MLPSLSVQRPACSSESPAFSEPIQSLSAFLPVACFTQLQNGHCPWRRARAPVPQLREAQRSPTSTLYCLTQERGGGLRPPPLKDTNWVPGGEPSRDRPSCHCGLGRTVWARGEVLSEINSIKRANDLCRSPTRQCGWAGRRTRWVGGRNSCSSFSNSLNVVRPFG